MGYCKRKFHDARLYLAIGWPVLLIVAGISCLALGILLLILAHKGVFII